MDIFVYNEETGDVEVNSAELLLIKEFAAMWDKKRNKVKGDSTGRLRLRAKKELAFIKLFIDWKSPYSSYREQDKLEVCLLDAGLKKEDLQDPIFKAACRKYQEIQESPITIRLIKAAQLGVEQLIIYFQTLDLTKTDDDGKPIFKAKDATSVIESVTGVLTELQRQEELIKKQMEDTGDVRGGVELGHGDDC